MLSSGALLATATLPTLLISGLALLYGRWYYLEKRRKEEDSQSLVMEANNACKVLFFPDRATAQSLSSASSPVPGSEDSVDEGSLSVLMSTIQEATETLDVCVFTISCKELGDVLINAHHDGVIVRVITDKEQSFVSGSQVERLRRMGIQVRTDNTSYYMHHKFAVIDERIVINGSLNWTLQGVCGNQENVVITTTPKVVEPFCRQFESLWEMYDPETLHQ